MQHVTQYISDAKTILDGLDSQAIEDMIQRILTLREQGGRLFFLGVGGSAANCSHAVNDFRKIAGIESYAPVDNVPELTARTNDEGWHTVFDEYLKTSRLRKEDALFILSVGGGDKERGVSANIVHAIDLARERGASVLGIVGRADGYTAKNADACVVVPVPDKSTLTPHAEAFQGLIWHLMVSDPRVMLMKNKWESLASV